MKYDLIIIGGGPGGLAAAWTAAGDGLKVLLLERRKDIPKVRRLCGQFTNINMISVTGIYKYGYSEPLHLEVGTAKTTVHWPAIGLSMDYDGPIKPYMNYVHFSPGGNILYRIKDRFFGFYWEKESLLRGLLGYAESAGAEIITGATARNVENTPNGVRVTADVGDKSKTFEARKLIAADGKGSRIANQLGVFKDRCITDLTAGGVGFVVEGVETNWNINNWLCFTVPSLSHIANLWMFQLTGDKCMMGAAQQAGFSANEATEKFMQLPAYKSWFKNARVVDKRVFGMKGMYRPLEEPIVGNILILGEAAGINETSNPGAIACGHQAAKAVMKEISGEQGFKPFCTWWQNAFEGNDPDHGKAAARFFSLNSLCTDEEVDYLYKTYQGQIGVPALTIASDLDRIKDERPELYSKLKKTGMAEGLKAVKIDWDDIMVDRKNS